MSWEITLSLSSLFFKFWNGFGSIGLISVVFGSLKGIPNSWPGWPRRASFPVFAAESAQEGFQGRF